MEKFKMNSNGIETLSPKECVMVKGDDLYVTTIHDDGTRDEPVPYN